MKRRIHRRRNAGDTTTSQGILSLMQTDGVKVTLVAWEKPPVGAAAVEATTSDTAVLYSPITIEIYDAQPVGTVLWGTNEIQVKVGSDAWVTVGREDDKWGVYLGATAYASYVQIEDISKTSPKRAWNVGKVQLEGNSPSAADLTKIKEVAALHPPGTTPPLIFGISTHTPVASVTTSASTPVTSPKFIPLSLETYNALPVGSVLWGTQEIQIKINGGEWATLASWTDDKYKTDTAPYGYSASVQMHYITNMNQKEAWFCGVAAAPIAPDAIAAIKSAAQSYVQGTVPPMFSPAATSASTLAAETHAPVETPATPLLSPDGMQSALDALPHRSVVWGYHRVMLKGAAGTTNWYIVAERSSSTGKFSIKTKQKISKFQAAAWVGSPVGSPVFVVWVGTPSTQVNAILTALQVAINKANTIYENSSDAHQTYQPIMLQMGGTSAGSVAHTPTSAPAHTPIPIVPSDAYASLPAGTVVQGTNEIQWKDSDGRWWSVAHYAGYAGAFVLNTDPHWYHTETQAKDIGLHPHVVGHGFASIEAVKAAIIAASPSMDQPKWLGTLAPPAAPPAPAPPSPQPPRKTHSTTPQSTTTWIPVYNTAALATTQAGALFFACYPGAASGTPVFQAVNGLHTVTPAGILAEAPPQSAPAYWFFVRYLSSADPDPGELAVLHLQFPTVPPCAPANVLFADKVRASGLISAGGGFTAHDDGFYLTLPRWGAYYIVKVDAAYLAVHAKITSQSWRVLRTDGTHQNVKELSAAMALTEHAMTLDAAFKACGNHVLQHGGLWPTVTIAEAQIQTGFNPMPVRTSSGAWTTAQVASQYPTSIPSIPKLTLGYAAALVTDGTRVLLTMTQAGDWQIPAIERALGETPEDSSARAFIEALGAMPTGTAQSGVTLEGTDESGNALFISILTAPSNMVDVWRPTGTTMPAGWAWARAADLQISGNAIQWQPKLKGAAAEPFEITSPKGTQAGTVVGTWLTDRATWANLAATNVPAAIQALFTPAMRAAIQGGNKLPYTGALIQNPRRPAVRVRANYGALHAARLPRISDVRTRNALHLPNVGAVFDIAGIPLGRIWSGHLANPGQLRLNVDHNELVSNIYAAIRQALGADAAPETGTAAQKALKAQIQQAIHGMHSSGGHTAWDNETNKGAAKYLRYLVVARQAGMWPSIIDPGERPVYRGIPDVASYVATQTGSFQPNAYTYAQMNALTAAGLLTAGGAITTRMKAAIHAWIKAQAHGPYGFVRAGELAWTKIAQPELVPPSSALSLAAIKPQSVYDKRIATPIPENAHVSWANVWGLLFDFFPQRYNSYTGTHWSAHPYVWGDQSTNGWRCNTRDMRFILLPGGTLNGPVTGAHTGEVEVISVSSDDEPFVSDMFRFEKDSKLTDAQLAGWIYSHPPYPPSWLASHPEHTPNPAHVSSPPPSALADVSRVNVLVFPRAAFASASEARDWTERNGYGRKAPEATDKYFRIRMTPASAFRPGSFKQVALTDGVCAIVGEPR